MGITFERLHGFPAVHFIWFSKISIEMLFRRHMIFHFNNGFFHSRIERDFQTSVCIIYIHADKRQIIRFTFPTNDNVPFTT